MEARGRRLFRAPLIATLAASVAALAVALFVMIVIADAGGALTTGFGDVTISVDTAEDATSPAATDLNAANSQDLVITFADGTEVGDGETVVLNPPTGLVFVTPAPDVVVGGAGVGTAAASAAIVSGDVVITFTGAGAAGALTITVGGGTPSLLQPTNGANPGAQGGEITATGTAGAPVLEINSGISNITVTHGAATQLAVQTQPAGATGGTAFTAQPVVEIQDQFGNVVTSDSTTDVTAAINNNPGTGVLGGTQTVMASDGVATFTNLEIDKAGDGYTLDFTATGLVPATSGPFNVSAGTATQLGIQTQPGNGIAGLALSPQPVIAIQDQFGSVVTSDSTTEVTAAIETNPEGGTLSGTLTVEAVNGVVTFTNLEVDTPGTGYTLKFTSSPVLTAAISSAFNVAAVGALTATILSTNPASLREDDLDGATVRVEIDGGTFDAALATGDFAVGGTVPGTTIETVTRLGNTRARITLEYDGTDFDANRTLDVTVKQSALSSGTGPATSGTVTVTAIVEGAGITVTPTTGLETTEGGGTDTFTVVLTSEPTADVTIGISSDDTTEGTVSPTSLTFTAVNFSTPQTVTVTGVADAVDDGNIAYTVVTDAAVSGDGTFDGINPANVAVTNLDNDGPVISSLGAADILAFVRSLLDALGIDPGAGALSDGEIEFEMEIHVGGMEIEIEIEDGEMQIEIEEDGEEDSDGPEALALEDNADDEEDEDENEEDDDDD